MPFLTSMVSPKHMAQYALILTPKAFNNSVPSLQPNTGRRRMRWNSHFREENSSVFAVLWNVVIPSLVFWLPRKELREVDSCSISVWYKAGLPEAAHCPVLFSSLPQYHPGSAILATECWQALVTDVNLWGEKVECTFYTVGSTPWALCIHWTDWTWILRCIFLFM